MEVERLLQRLQTDNTSGAMTLLEFAIDILNAFADPSTGQTHIDFHSALDALIAAILTAQPSMAPMVTLAQQALQACPEDLPAATARQQLHQTLTAFRQQTHESTAALCKQALSILPPQATVLTYSNSSTVVSALLHAHEQGRLRRVLLSESRPAFDGRLQAAALLERGIPVEYSVDMGLFERLSDIQVVLVGADAVFPHGLVNKLGTRTLVQMAHLQHIPAFSLCTTTKFLPAAAAPLLRLTDHPREEVWPDAPAALQIRNHYFDTTPLSLFSGIVSEHGIHAPAVLRSTLRHHELSPMLQRLAAGRAASNNHGTLASDATSLKTLKDR